MKFLILVLVFMFSVSSFAWNENQVKECKNKFDNYIPENMALTFVCTDPSTIGTRSSFISLQYSVTQYNEDGTENYLQHVVVCSSNHLVSSINQSNDFVNGVGLLRLIGDDVDDGDESYLAFISEQNKRTLKGLSQFDCTDSFGRPLTD